ncbi:Na/Pi cotransporter family protein, partial [Staphylococcus pseudintermedius]
MFTFLLPIVNRRIATIEDEWQCKQWMTIACANGAVNVTNILVKLPFVCVLAGIVTKMV